MNERFRDKDKSDSLIDLLGSSTRLAVHAGPYQRERERDIGSLICWGVSLGLRSMRDPIRERERERERD